MRQDLQVLFVGLASLALVMVFWAIMLVCTRPRPAPARTTDLLVIDLDRKDGVDAWARLTDRQPPRRP